MKLLTGLGIFVAVLAFAWIPASVSASELCSTNTSPCSGTKYKNGTALTAQLNAGGSTTFTNSLSNITCKGSALAGKVTVEGGVGIPVEGEVSSLTFTNCETSSGISCRLTSKNLGYTVRMAALLGGLIVLLPGSGLGEVSTMVNCGTLIKNCEFYGSWGGAFFGGNPATFTTGVLGEVERKTSGEICPEGKVIWEAKYEMTSPKPLFVVNL